MGFESSPNSKNLHVNPGLGMAMEVYARMGTFTEYEIAPYARYEDGK